MLTAVSPSPFPLWANRWAASPSPTGMSCLDSLHLCWASVNNKLQTVFICIIYSVLLQQPQGIFVYLSIISVLWYFNAKQKNINGLLNWWTPQSDWNEPETSGWILKDQQYQYGSTARAGLIQSGSHIDNNNNYDWTVTGTPLEPVSARTGQTSSCAVTTATQGACFTAMMWKW